MQTDWLLGLAGGTLIGVAGAMFLLLNGRIMGASGILGSVVDGTACRRLPENLVFLAALVAVPWVLSLVAGGSDTRLTPQIWVIVAGGLMVGFGTRVASGCTSGHGVCGISRLSRRGIAATLAYIGAGALAVVMLRHIWSVI